MPLRFFRGLTTPNINLLVLLPNPLSSFKFCADDSDLSSVDEFKSSGTVVTNHSNGFMEVSKGVLLVPKLPSVS